MSTDLTVLEAIVQHQGFASWLANSLFLVGEYEEPVSFLVSPKDSSTVESGPHPCDL
jgi:hypothetical protein